MTTQRIIPGDCIEGLRTLPDASVHCCVTSPPYWGLRDYGHDGQIGLEATPEAYVARMVEVFREVRRVLREDGTLWLNLGDSYVHNTEKHPPQRGTDPKMATCNRAAASESTGVRKGQATGLPSKNLVGIPWRVAFALQADGWWLRQDIIWHKPNPMPESVRDRCTKAHEYVFLLTKSERYYYDAEAVSEAQTTSGQGGFSNKATLKSVVLGAVHKPSLVNATNDGRRNRRSVWTITTKPYSGAHFAVMPSDLVEPCIKAGCPEQCCPVCGRGWGRVVEKGKPVSASSENRFATNKKRDEAYCRNDGGTLGNMNGKIWAEHKAANPDKFLGWAPACECAATGTIPGTVLDPFAGSGTTLAVAAELGRSGIGCELNPEYIQLAEQRIKDARASVALFEGAVA
jgi:site-specific DNA-methyltransferase (adenine-specific)